METKALYRTGVKKGAIDNDAIMVGVDGGWRLICAPPATSTATYSLLFWEPDSADDCKPMFSKVVCKRLVT